MDKKTSGNSTGGSGTEGGDDSRNVFQLRMDLDLQAERFEREISENENESTGLDLFESESEPEFDLEELIDEVLNLDFEPGRQDEKELLSFAVPEEPVSVETVESPQEISFDPEIFDLIIDARPPSDPAEPVLVELPEEEGFSLPPAIFQFRAEDEPAPEMELEPELELEAEAESEAESATEIETESEPGLEPVSLESEIQPPPALPQPESYLPPVMESEALAEDFFARAAEMDISCGLEDEDAAPVLLRRSSSTDITGEAGGCEFMQPASFSDNMAIFLALFAQRFASRIKKSSKGDWHETSRFHYLSDDEIVEAIAGQSSFQRAVSADTTTGYLALTIDEGSFYRSEDGLARIRSCLSAAGLGDCRMYKASDSEQWQIVVFFIRPVSTSKVRQALDSWMRRNGIVPGTAGVDLVPNASVFPLPLQPGFCFLNDNGQVIAQRDEISLEAALALFIADIGRTVINGSKLLGRLEVLNAALRAPKVS
ncbi:MAG: hypothetical protein KC777_12970 [Cyanobacteria bacterium HKST-UBA02]|nr:hypothetical protein [Cyanobacteria bacterium HKST-UBA02]